jgi:hypothetical protein
MSTFTWLGLKRQIRNYSKGDQSSYQTRQESSGIQRAPLICPVQCPGAGPGAKNYQESKSLELERDHICADGDTWAPSSAGQCDRRRRFSLTLTRLSAMPLPFGLELEAACVCARISAMQMQFFL